MKKKVLSIIAAVAMIMVMSPASAFAANAVNLPAEMNGQWGGAEATDVVYYNDGNQATDDYYATMSEALTAVFMSSPTDVAKVYCKPGADLGKMTHGHVADNIDIYGNGAYISGGEYDMEFDTYKYDRKTGKQSPSGEFLTKDITVNVTDLNGIAAWGQRNTSFAVNVNFTNCKNMNRVYINGTSGVNNISLNDCSFEAAKGSHSNTSIYSNAPGNIIVKSTAFSGIAVPVNLNNKSAGVQNVTIEGCTFNDCSTPDLAKATNSTTYAAPVRIVVQEKATTNLNVGNSEFKYSADKCLNGDILLGDGRASAKPNSGKIIFEMNGTSADVQQQKPGYYDGNGNVAEAGNVIVTPVKKNESASLNDAGKIKVEDQTATEPTNPTVPTTPSGDQQENAKEPPKTGDNNIAVTIATLCLALSAIGLVAIKKRKIQ